MSIKMLPLYDRVIIKSVEEETVTAGGIIIPDTAQKKPCKGVVVAIGSGVRGDDGNFVALTVKVGDVVLFEKWGGTEIKVGDEELLVMKESSIIAIDQDESAQA